jgi:hypothetical protein
MALSDTPYSPQIKVVQLLERSKAQTVELKVFRNGANVAPDSFTYSLSKPNGDKLVEAQAGSVVDGVAQYTISAGVLVSTLNLGEGYLEEWAMSFSGSVYHFRRMAAIVLRRLYPVVSDGDLTATYSQLADIRPASLSSYQTYIDEAWFTIISRLRREGGGLEYLVMSAESFRSAHQNLSLYYIFRDFHSSLGQSNGRYLDLANEHFQQYGQEWKQINFIYDQGHDNKAEDANTRKAKQPVIYLNGNGNTRSFTRRY